MHKRKRSCDLKRPGQVQSTVYNILGKNLVFIKIRDKTGCAILILDFCFGTKSHYNAHCSLVTYPIWAG